MNELLEKRFFGCIFWGIILNLGGAMLAVLQHFPFIKALGWVMLLVGFGLMMIGLAFYVRSKGRNPAWCILGILSILGLLIIVLLPAKPEKIKETTLKPVP